MQHAVSSPTLLREKAQKLSNKWHIKLIIKLTMRNIYLLLMMNCMTCKCNILNMSCDDFIYIHVINIILCVTSITCFSMFMMMRGAECMRYMYIKWEKLRNWMKMKIFPDNHREKAHAYSIFRMYPSRLLCVYHHHHHEHSGKMCVWHDEIFREEIFTLIYCCNICSLQYAHVRHSVNKQ